MSTFISELFIASGRMGRLRFFLSVVTILAGVGVFVIITDSISNTAVGRLIAPFFIIFVLIVPNCMVAFQVIKRLHDFNRSGWYYFLVLVPIVNIILWLLLFFKPGTAGANDYGADPIPSSKKGR
jgi:uncharacterized membrane protein YhaH (DUF805 family)